MVPYDLVQDLCRVEPSLKVALMIVWSEQDILTVGIRTAENLWVGNPDVKPSWLTVESYYLHILVHIAFRVELLAQDLSSIAQDIQDLSYTKKKGVDHDEDQLEPAGQFHVPFLEPRNKVDDHPHPSDRRDSVYQRFRSKKLNICQQPSLDMTEMHYVLIVLVYDDLPSQPSIWYLLLVKM